MTKDNTDIMHITLHVIMCTTDKAPVTFERTLLQDAYSKDGVGGGLQAHCGKLFVMLQTCNCTSLGLGGEIQIVQS